MEYCEASPDPSPGVGGYYSPTTTEEGPNGYKEDTNSEASIEDASSLPTLDYSNLYITPEVERHFNSMSQGTEMPNNVLTEDDDQTDPEQEEETNQENWQIHDNLDKESEEDDTIMEGKWVHQTRERRGKKVAKGWIGTQEQLTHKETHNWDSDTEREGEGQWPSGSENEPSANSSSESGTEWSEVDDQQEDSQDKEGEGKRSIKANLKTESASKPQPVLCFDEYGNLITSYQRTEEPYTSQELNVEVESAEGEVATQESDENIKTQLKIDAKHSRRRKSTNNSSSEEASDGSPCNGEARASRSKLKVRHESGEGSAVSDLELKQAFKEDFMTAAMSRYGRARKRKTEDGFFFGTLNFNELRKITSNSPKKNKGTGSKNSSPDQKSKLTTKEEGRVRLRLDEAVDNEIQSWQARQDEADTEKVDDASKVQSLSETKDGNELVQNIVEDIKEREVDDIEAFNDNFKESHGELVQESSQVLEDVEERPSIPDPQCSVSGNSNPSPIYKEDTSADVSQDISDSKDRSSEGSLDSARVERRKRLSLRRRSERSSLREHPKSTENRDHILRRRSDVGRKKSILDASDLELPPRRRLRRSHTLEEPQTNESTTSCTDSQDSQDDLWVPERSMKSPRAETVSTEENKDAGELASTTKSGRTIRKPQIMDVSDEEKRQRLSREQLRQSEALLNSSLDYDPVAAGIDMRALEQEHPCEYLVGDLVWVHIRGSPLWPAMVSYHPRLGQYTRISVAQNWYKIRSVRLYHVQFFSDNAQTYWIAPINVLPFEGLPKLTEYLIDLKSKAKEMKKSKKVHIDSLLKTLMHINKISTGQKHERWNRAIEEGKAAMELDRYERIRKYALEYPEIQASEDVTENKLVPKHSALKPQRSGVETRPKRKRGRPRKHPEKQVSVSKSSNKSNGDSTDGEFSGFDENSSFEEKKRRLALTTKLSKEGSFKVYAQKYLQEIMDDFPNISEETARNKLRWRWKKMNNSQTSRYKSKFSSFESDSLSDSLKRKYEPSFDTPADDSNGASAAKRKRTEEFVDNLRGVYKVVRNEKVCYRCEGVSTKGGNDMVRCKGLCCSVFHLECIGLSSLPKRDFKCEECLTGQNKCFLCKSAEGGMQRCTVPFCGKFYHDVCIQKWPHVAKQRQQERFVCPRHVCHMCAANADDMCDPVARTPPFTRCLRCPTTYHTGEECIAAGTEEISQHHHICTKHLTLPKNAAHHVNVNWCFCCSKGGSLLLCDQCPAAFHADCIKITAPEGGYVCEDCENGKFPVYGDIVWVKLGIYRWWPGQVLHPRFIPDNIENLPHQQGMFCVHFFGSNDYYWVTKGRTFHYQEGDKGSKAASSKTLEKQFQRALEEAADAYRALKVRKAEQEAYRSEKGNLKPPPYVRIDSNRPVGNVRLSKLDLAAVNRCDCDPDSENPCGSDEKCLNRMLMFECVREVCGAGDKCGNQRFQKRLYPNLCCFKTEGRGWGLKTLEDVRKGQFVIEYVGELIDDEEFRRRIEEMHKVKEENYYFLTIDKDIMIDAGPKGNLARFMNHSCQPNCETQKWTVGGDTRVGLFAICDMPAGSELTFNYNLQCVGTEKKRCRCGAPNCSGFIGVKVQKQNDNQGPKRDKLGKRKRKRRRREAKMSEDECFRCGGHGDLILCDIATCPKGYHLECLGLEKLPKGKWICPWHHCDECGQRSVRLNRCDFCPNSFCRQHLPGNLQTVSGIGNFCQEHDSEELEALRGQMAIAEVNEDQISGEPGEQPVEEVKVDKDSGVGLQDTEDSNLSEKPKENLEKPSTEALPNTVDAIVLPLDASVKAQGEQEVPSPKTKAPVLPLRKRVGHGRAPRSPKVPDGPENSSAVLNVSGDAPDVKGPAKRGRRGALKTVVRKNVRKRARAESVAKPINEA